MQVLITGVAGFIGFHLAERLLAMGHTVVGVDCLNDYYEVTLKYARLSQLGLASGRYSREGPLNLAHNLRFLWQINLSVPSEIDDCCGQYQFDCIIHLAAQPGVGYSFKKPKSIR